MRLNKYYIPTRYPDVWSEGIPEEQYMEREYLEAISMAEEALKWVLEAWKSLRKEQGGVKNTLGKRVSSLSAYYGN